MSALAPILEAHEISRHFGRHRAVDGLSFTVGAGQSLALFGPNGAGKTTLLRMLAGLLRPTSGQATISGTDVRAQATIRGMVGLISHQTMLYPALTALENVEFAARLHGVASPRDASQRALTTLGVGHRATTLVRSLSRGLQQRVSIARALVHDPAVLLLDEPYTGLDASGAAALTELLHGLRIAGATLVLVTHNVVEGLAVASHAAVMLNGKLARLGPSADVDAAEFARDYGSLAVSGGAESMAGAR
jgi:heme exporter protein A